VGSISPPGVVSNKEWDALNVWRAGNAAFMRNWPIGFKVSRSSASAVKDRFNTTMLPRGRAGHAATLGGGSFGIFGHSSHQHEASQLVKFLSRRDLQLRRTLAHFDPPSIRDLYSDPETEKAVAYFAHVQHGRLHGIVLRPAMLAGKKYPEVSQAYFGAVHSVLTGQKQPEYAVAELQQELVRITGFPEGPSKR
jgi:trehalose/maltose transport system substrate-binding protein